METPTRSDLTATTPDGPELQDISRSIKLELGKSGLSRFTIGQRLEDAFTLLGTDKKFNKYLTAQLSDCLSLRHARRYRDFFKDILARAEADGISPEKYLEQHPELGVWEKWQKAKKKKSVEDEVDDDSPIRDPADSYTSDSEDVDHQQVLKNIGTLFENIFSYKFKDVADLKEWEYVFRHQQDGLPLKPYHRAA